MLNYRKTKPCDDADTARIIRSSLEKLHLNVPGTAYFDPESDHLSTYYNSAPEKLAYFVAADDEGHIVDGTGIAEFDGMENCAELQKLYLDDTVIGKGCGKELLKTAEDFARSAGYKNLYLETHSSLTAALNLYEKTDYRQIEKPCSAQNGAMNRFYLKEL